MEAHASRAFTAEHDLVEARNALSEERHSHARTHEKLADMAREMRIMKSTRWYRLGKRLGLL